MSLIKTDHEDGLLIARMAAGKANTMTLALIAEFREVAAQARQDSTIRAVVIGSATPRFFSAGFDVAEVFAYDRPTMREFFGEFIDLYESIHGLPKPVVADIHGHAYAGGAVIAVTADARVFVEGDYGFALNEVNLGVVLTPGVMRMAVEAAGTRAARELLLGGATLTPARAGQCGLADIVAGEGDSLARAIEQARMLASKPAAAFAGIKKALRGEHPSDRSVLEPFLDQWFSEESVAARNALIESLRIRRAPKPA